MNYKESEIDKKNREWFNNNRSCNTLVSISIARSSIRGLNQLNIEFKYPIVVIAGENGCGKSTILSLVSCAFHNNTGFCPMSLLSNKKHQRVYYTYSDFFAFTAEERGFMRDIQITSKFLTENTKRNTDTRSQSPRKGRWKDYDTRPKRAVSFLGINRILPPSESNTFRNYCRHFGDNRLTENESRALVGYMKKIFGKAYTEISLRKLNKYRLYGCSRDSNVYTGFNMGAGENAVLQMLHEIISAGKGSLIVIDEIELGLHVRAQKQLMLVLKELCKQYCAQIVCSSHSETIIGAIPPDGRILLKPKQNGVDIIYGVTPEMAMSELSGILHTELSVFVEDEVARNIIQTILPNDIRRRVNLIVIGSADSSMIYAICTHLREGNKRFVVIMDGDKQSEKDEKIKKVVSSMEDCNSIDEREIRTHLEDRISFLPGNEWPEKVMLESIINQNDFTRLLEDFNVDSDEQMRQYINKALVAGKHHELYELASNLHLNVSEVQTSVVRQYKVHSMAMFQSILDVINQALN